MKQLILFLFSIFILTSGYTSVPNYKFKRITSKDGLSNDWVRGFFQDDIGFIWVGTSDGLNRYDGNSFKTFRPINEDNFELGNFTVNDIIEKDSLNLWICSDIGLYKFNLENEIFTLDTLLNTHPVITALKDENEVYWFGTNHGLIKYDKETEQKTSFNSIENDSTCISSDYINTLFLDSKYNLWIGTSKGLNLLTNNEDQFICFQCLDNKNKLIDPLSICEDEKNRIWIGTANNGLFLINPNSIETIKIKEGNISSLTIDDRRQLWIGYTNGSGIEIFDLESFDKGQRKSVFLEKDLADESTLSDNSITCFFNDKIGDLWIGTFSNGISYFSERSKPFYNISAKKVKYKSINNNLVNVFYEEEKYLWIGTEGGLNRLNKETNTFEYYISDPMDPNSIGANAVLAIKKDSKGNLWIGTWAGGLNLYNYKKNNFKRYLPDSKDSGSLKSAHIFSIIEDADSNLWIGTNAGGLSLFNYNDESFTNYINNPNDASSLSGRSINSMLQTSSGDLYISMYSILDKFNKEHNNFIHYVMNDVSKDYISGSITDLFEDSNNNLWITTNIGLELFNPVDNSYKRYTTDDGLPDNTIQAILEDNNKNLWISTNKGLTKFINGANAPNNPSFINFSTDDGLNSYVFNSRSAYKNDEGILFFGSTNGYTYFNPDSITLNTITPNIVLTNFFIQDSNPNESTNFEPLKTNINFTKRIELYYPNTDFIIGFAALNYLNSEKNNFKYKLEGYDTEWINSNHSQLASYTNLQEGEYVFNVIGANNDGFWNNNAAEIIISVHPPWWKSLLFRIFLFIAVLLIGLIIIFVRFNDINNEKKLLEAKVEKRTNELSKLNELLEEKQHFISEQNKELEKHHSSLEQLVDERTKELSIARKKAEESDKLKSSFLANMSHEIRTPLNAIMGFSTILGRSDLTQSKRDKYIKHIENNGKALILLVSDILDISIIEANQMVLSTSTFSVNSLLNELYIIFEQENKNKLEFINSNTENKYDVYVTTDAFRLRQILINLLSNAFKYTDEGSVNYGFSVNNNIIQFFISDTGIGIKEKDQKHIFDLFYKTDKEKSKLYRGTGIGLAICKKLINQLGGEIWLDSEINSGTTFYFTVPIKNK